MKPRGSKEGEEPILARCTSAITVQPRGPKNQVEVLEVLPGGVHREASYYSEAAARPSHQSRGFLTGNIFSTSTLFCDPRASCCFNTALSFGTTQLRNVL